MKIESIIITIDKSEIASPLYLTPDDKEKLSRADRIQINHYNNSLEAQISKTMCDKLQALGRVVRAKSTFADMCGVGKSYHLNIKPTPMPDFYDDKQRKLYKKAWIKYLNKKQKLERKANKKHKRKTSK
jgi:hypothetical protein